MIAMHWRVGVHEYVGDGKSDGLGLFVRDFLGKPVPVRPGLGRLPKEQTHL